MTRLNISNSVLAVLAFMSFFLGAIAEQEFVNDEMFNLMTQDIDGEEFFGTEEIERSSELNDLTGTVLYGDYADEEGSEKH